MVKIVIVILVICTSHGFLGVAGDKCCATVHGRTNGTVANIRLMDKNLLTDDDRFYSMALQKPSHSGLFYLSGCVYLDTTVSTLVPYLKITCTNSETTIVDNEDIIWTEEKQNNMVGKLPKNFKYDAAPRVNDMFNPSRLVSAPIS